MSSAACRFCTAPRTTESASARSSSSRSATVESSRAATTSAAYLSSARTFSSWSPPTDVTEPLFRGRARDDEGALDDLNHVGALTPPRLRAPLDPSPAQEAEHRDAHRKPGSDEHQLRAKAADLEHLEDPHATSRGNPGHTGSYGPATDFFSGSASCGCLPSATCRRHPPDLRAELRGRRARLLLASVFRQPRARFSARGCELIGANRDAEEYVEVAGCAPHRAHQKEGTPHVPSEALHKEADEGACEAEAYCRELRHETNDGSARDLACEGPSFARRRAPHALHACRNLPRVSRALPPRYFQGISVDT